MWINAVNSVTRLPPLDTSKYQVQVVWLKQALIFEDNNPRHPPLDTPFPDHAETLQADLEQILRNIKLVFPNTQIVYLSPRTYAYTLDFHSPEPKAYETGFAVKWTIQKQIDHPGGSIGYLGGSPGCALDLLGAISLDGWD